jgi:hypothetical protein
MLPLPGRWVLADTMQEPGRLKGWCSLRRMGVLAWIRPWLFRTLIPLPQVMCHRTTSRWLGLAERCA